MLRKWGKTEPIRNRVGQSRNGGHRERGETLRYPPVRRPPCGGLHSAAGRSSQPKCGTVMTPNKSALITFDDDPIGIIQTSRRAGSWLPPRADEQFPKKQRPRREERVFQLASGSSAKFSLNYILKLPNIVHKGPLTSLNPDSLALNDIKESNILGLSSSPRLLIRRRKGFHNSLTPDAYRVQRPAVSLLTMPTDALISRE